MSTLLDFPFVTDGRTRMVEQSTRLTHSEVRLLTRLGDLLQRAKDDLGLSDRELAKRSDMSRQHVRHAIAGGNLSVIYLLRIVRALEIPPKELTNLGLHLVAALQHIEEAASHLAAATAALRGDPNTAEVADAKPEATDAQAAALVRDVMAKAKTLGPDRLSVLDETLRDLVASIEQPRVSDRKGQRSGAGWRRAK